REGHRVGVSEIDIREGNGAAGIEIAAVVDVGVLGHRAGLGGEGNHRHVVGANDGDRHLLGRANPAIVGDRHVISDGKGLPGGEARKSGVLPARKVPAIERDPDPVLSAVEAESAPARTASIPLGGVTPPDQVALVMLVLTVWWSLRSTSVKVSVPVVVRSSA